MNAHRQQSSTHLTHLSMVGVTAWAIMALSHVSGRRPPTATAPLNAGQAEPVQVQMRNVAFHIDSTVILHIGYLRGELRRASATKPPDLDDKRSFLLAIDSASIAMTPAALSDLFNHYTFAYPGSPLRSLTVTLDHGRVKQQGTMHGVRFTILGDLAVTPQGALRLRPRSIKAAGISVGGLMKFFGVQLQKLIDTKGAVGVRVDGNDLLLSPTRLLPPPQIDGRLTSVAVNDSEIVQVFRSLTSQTTPALALRHAAPANYMFFRHGVLRFGKLTMVDTDLLIMDATPRDPFDFFLDRYNEQLVAGWSRNTVDHGLVVTMPDFQKVHGLKHQRPRSTSG